MRNPTACMQCRRAKRRCLRHKASEACTSCQVRQLACEGKPQGRHKGQRHLVPRLLDGYAVGMAAVRAPQRHYDFDRRRQAPSTPEERPVSRSRIELSHGMAVELVEHYLDKIDGRPHSIFHPATLRSQVHDGTLKETVLYAICAIGCKFSANPETRHQGEYLLVESKRLLQADISNICLENIQACILIALLSVGHGDSSSEALFFRMYQCYS
jgi:hypothetical protein